MPSPIAHSITGYALSQLPTAQRLCPAPVDHKQQQSETLSKLRLPLIHHFHRGSIAIAIYAFILASLPDLDFLPQLITGIRFHRGPSHSLLAALLVSALLSLILYRPLRLTFLRLFSFSLILYISHLLLDLFTAGGSGLPLLWPLSSYGFRAPIPLLPPVHHSKGLIDASHLVFLSAEAVYSAGLMAFVWWRRKKNSQHRRMSTHPHSAAPRPSQRS